ncbi:MAG: class IV adenylate cyclase [bacterium]|nr:class IV adenylate cyclase [bacterium]
MRNLEIKARYSNHEQLERQLKKYGARLVSGERQVDTYFSVPRGRLKLREIRGGKAELIYYQRGERSTRRWSDYYLYHCAQPKELKDFLKKIYPVRVIVDKRRTLYRYRNAKIHVDRVKGLGNFMEIEVQQARAGTQTAKLMGTLLQYLRIPASDFIRHSYSDLLLRK